MVLEISLGELYTALYEDPDLRRLGKYKVMAEPKQTILPIDLSDFEGQDIHFGEGDFTDGFFALCRTKARSIDFGSCNFTDLYLDFIETETINFSNSQASRLYFDEAKIKNCYFGEFISGEVYFDTSTVENVDGQNLSTGIIFIEEFGPPIFDPEILKPSCHRLVYGANNEESDTNNVHSEETGIRKISKVEFLQYLIDDCDLRRLGPYKIIVEGDDDSLDINLNFENMEVWFGDGDFSEVSVSLAGLVAKTIDFGGSVFTKLDLTEAKAENCFFYRSEAVEMHFGTAELGSIFFERCRSNSVLLEKLKCGQLNINDLETDELRLGESTIREIYLSVGVGVRSLYCDKAKLDLLNVHEGTMDLLDFGESEIRKALLNKAIIRVVRCEDLRADKLYIGNDGKNKIGELHLGLRAGIRELDMDKALKPEPPTERTIIDKIY